MTPPTTRGVSLRTLEPTDAAEVGRLVGELGYPAEPTGTIRRRIEELAGDPAHAVYAAVAGRRIVGWVHVFESRRLTAEPRAEIAGLVVREGDRRAGVGRRLVERCEAWAAGRGVGVTRVRCNLRRRGAHRFYRALGFAEIKRQSVFERGEP